MSFSPKVKDDALFDCGRHCCLCHKFCGIKIEIHHIQPKASGGPNTYSNAIPLCFDCHADMRTYDFAHPKGTKYSEAELVRHRDAWYAKVKNTGGILEVSTIPADKVVFAELIRVLPWNTGLSFMSAKKISGVPIEIESFEKLSDFQTLCEEPQFEFLDADLEGLKAVLYQAVTVLIDAIGNYTTPSEKSGFIHVSPQWKIEGYSEQQKAVKDIDEASSKVLQSYRELFSLARRKLGDCVVLSAQ